MIEAEAEREWTTLVGRAMKVWHEDLEALEHFIRNHVLKIGADALEQVIQTVGEDSEVPQCSHNHLPRRMQSSGRRTKRIRTILGNVKFRRSRYVCPECNAVRYPGDEILGVQGTSFSPASRRMMTRAGSRVSFIDGAEDLREYASLHVHPKDIERVAEAVGEQIAKWMDAQGGAALLYEANGDVPPEAGPPVEKFYVSFDGTGIPMRCDELRHTKGKGPDGRAQTREVKLGCVFTQIAQDEKGLPIRDPHSTTYVGAIVDSNTFGHQIHAEAVRRGMRQAKHVIALTDGIPYNKTIVAEHFPDATHILDLYHAREHLDDTVKLLGKVQPDKALAARWKRLLDKGLIESLIDQIRLRMPHSGERRKLIEKQIAYFQDNAELMRYAKFRKQGLFIGSGVIEAGCKTLIGQRLKQSGMFWSVRGANAIIAARCCSYSGRFEQFWEDQNA